MKPTPPANWAHQPLGPSPTRWLTQGRSQAPAGTVSVTSTAWDPKLEVAVSSGNHRLTVVSAAFGVTAAFAGL